MQEDRMDRTIGDAALEISLDTSALEPIHLADR